MSSTEVILCGVGICELTSFPQQFSLTFMRIPCRSVCPCFLVWSSGLTDTVLHGASTEGRPDNTGPKVAKELLAAGIPVTLILDSGVGFIMEKVDMLLVGAEGVVESGGIINYLGTFQTALVARSMNKPVYVAAESYKVCVLCHQDITLKGYDFPDSHTQNLFQTPFLVRFSL
jgi:hypothetical protein